MREAVLEARERMAGELAFLAGHKLAQQGAAGDSEKKAAERRGQYLGYEQREHAQPTVEHDDCPQCARYVDQKLDSTKHLEPEVLLKQRLEDLPERGHGEVQCGQQQHPQKPRLSIDHRQERRQKADSEADRKPEQHACPIKTGQLLRAGVLLRDDALREPSIGDQVRESEHQVDDRIEAEIERAERVRRRQGHDEPCDHVRNRRGRGPRYGFQRFDSKAHRFRQQDNMRHAADG